MRKAARRRARDVFGLLPEIQATRSVSVRDGDVVIFAPGFEDRTVALGNCLDNIGGAKSIFIDYRPFNDRNRLRDMLSVVAEKGMRPEPDDIIEYDRFAPGDFSVRLRDRIRQAGVKRVVLDISSMSKLLILLSLQVLEQMGTVVQVFYAEANEYCPSEEVFLSARAENRVHQPSLQVFSGVHGVVRADSLGSVAMQGHPLAAIVFMSFNDSLTQVLLNTVYPARLFLVNGQPPVHGWREHATAWIHEQVRREWMADNPQIQGTRHNREQALPARSVSTLDYRDTVKLLGDLYWELSARYRILLAPSGSKMQTVGCYFAKALHPDIHIEYPSPEGFSPEYSTGIGAKWTVDFGNFKKMIRDLSMADRDSELKVVMDGISAVSSIR